MTQHEVPKSDFFEVFKGLGPRVPQGGPKDPPRALKVSPKVPKWNPQAIKNWQRIDKKQPLFDELQRFRRAHDLRADA